MTVESAKCSLKGFVVCLPTRGYEMAKRTLARASTLILAGAKATTRNGLTFAFTCETLSDGTPTTIYANVRITDSGDVNVCDYEVCRAQIPGMDQKGPTPLADSDSADEIALEGYCLGEFVSRT